MLFRRLLLMMTLICLALWPAAGLGEAARIANRVPVIYISDDAGPADALTDDNAATVWYGPADGNSLTMLVASQTVKEIWIRSGARQDAQNYLAASRPSLLAVTVYYENQQVSTYRYRLLDTYAADNTRDWVDGYQRLLLPRAMNGVFQIELQVLQTVPGRSRAEVALSDILLSSGQPSPSGAGVQMRPSAPTVSPVSATMPPVSGDIGSTSPTSTPQGQAPEAPAPTNPPVIAPDGSVSATLLRDIGVRTGPGTGYDYVGTYFRGGETVQVISKVWDPVNTLYWLQVDFVAVGGYHYRGYCVREKRVDVDAALIPDDPEGTPVTVTERTGSYFGPGPDYRAHDDTIPAGTRGKIFATENEYVLFEWRDNGQNVNRRAWIPESVVSE